MRSPSSLLISLVSLLLPFLVSFSDAAALAPRASFRTIDPLAGVALVQWKSNGGTANHLRSYHVNKDGRIIESGYDANTGTWISNALPIPYTAQPGTTLCGGVRKVFGGDGPGDVEIRLFFKEQGGFLVSVRYTSDLGWHSDINFNNQGLRFEPRAIINWTHGNGLVEWRLYLVIYAENSGQPTREARLHEAGITLQGDSNTGDWWLRYKVTTFYVDQFHPAAIAAVPWANGNRISLFYWDNVDTIDIFRPGQIKELRWSEGLGWSERGAPNSGWKNFGYGGALAAATWVDARGVDQIRVYVRWQDPMNVMKTRMVEFSGNDKGWSRQSDDFPDYAVKGAGLLSQISAVAWTYPDGNSPHVRVHHSACPIGGFDDECNAFIREIKYDPDTSWKDGGYVDG